MTRVTQSCLVGNNETLRTIDANNLGPVEGDSTVSVFELAIQIALLKPDDLAGDGVAIGELKNVLFGPGPADRRQSQEQQYQRGQAAKRRPAMNIHVSCFSMKRVPEGDGG